MSPRLQFLDWWKADNPVKKYYTAESVFHTWDEARRAARPNLDCRAEFEKAWKETPLETRETFKSVDHVWWIWRAGWAQGNKTS